MKIENNTAQRTVPRYPLPKEKIKFHFDEGERIFAVRDMSLIGLGINLLEHGEVLLFPLGYECRAELKLDSEVAVVDVRVARQSAWAVGFTFEGISSELEQKLENFLNPIHVGRSLKPVNLELEPATFAEGISRWYHGDSGVDLFFWNDARGGVERALFCLGDSFWEWAEDDGIRTGTLVRAENAQATLEYHSVSVPGLRERVLKILEHADVLDYRLVNFLIGQSAGGFNG